jgi:hypothetical protein
MVFIPHDMDEMLRSPGRPVLPQAHGLVSKAVLRNGPTRKLYLERFYELYHNEFIAPVLTRRIDGFVRKLTPQIEAYDSDLVQEFMTGADSLKKHIIRRAGALERELKRSDPGSSSGPP